MATKNIVPRATGEGGIGTSAKRWLNGYFNNLDCSTAISTGTLTTSSTAFLGAGINFTGLSNFLIQTNIGTGNPGIVFDTGNYIDFNRTTEVMKVSTDTLELNAPGAVNSKLLLNDNSPTIRIGREDLNAYGDIRRDDNGEIHYDAAQPIYGEHVFDIAGVEALRIDNSRNATFNGDVTLTGNTNQIVTVQGSGAAFLRMKDTGAGVDQKTIDTVVDGGIYKVRQLNDDNSIKATPFTIDASGDASFSGDVSVTGTTVANRGIFNNDTEVAHTLFVRNNANFAPALISADSASMATPIQYLRAGRSASNTFDFFRCLSNQTALPTDTEFKLRGDGEAFADGSWTGGGADYAEWREKHPMYYQDDEGDWAGVAVAMLDGYAVKAVDHPEAPLIGIVSVNPAIVGNHDMQWKGKYLLDDFNRRILEDYEVVEWTESKITTPAKAAEYETVTKERQVTTVETVEQSVTSIELIDGKYVEVTTTEMVDRNVPVFDEVPLYLEDGSIKQNMVSPEIQAVDAVVDAETGEIIEPAIAFQAAVYENVVHKIPVMESYTEQVLISEAVAEVTEDVQHSYAADNVPTGVIVPENVTRTTQQREKLNPDFDPTLEHVSRADRPEYVCVGLKGFIPMLRDQTINGELLLADRWLIGKDDPTKTTIEVFI